MEVVHVEMYSEPFGVLYAADMVKRVLLGVQEFRTNLRDRLASSERGEHTVVAKRGKPVVVVVPIAWYREAAAALKDPTEY